MLEAPPKISSKQDHFIHRDLLQDTGLFVRVPLINVCQPWALVKLASRMKAVIAFIAAGDSVA